MILWLAPMDWISDLPCRVITKKIFNKYNKCNSNELILWSEFMTSDWFLACPENVVKNVINTPFESPIILQIFGWNKHKILKTALEIENLYWDKIAGIELNTGCPANNIMKSGWWSALLKDKGNTLNIIKELSQNLEIPFSVKSRTWLNDEDKAKQMDFLVKASDYCKKITVHSRTLKELYHGEWDWNFIYELKSKANQNCKIIWNWAINKYLDIEERIENNWIKLDGIMIWQAAIWNPWIFLDYEPSIYERIHTAIEHLELSAKYEIYLQTLKDNRKEKIYPKLEEIENIDIEKNLEKIHYTPLTFRKYFHQYMRWIKWWKELKQKCNEIKDFQWLIELLNSIEID